MIPNLNKEETRIAISSVVLSSQRVDFRGDALYNAAKDKGQQEAPSANPLVAFVTFYRGQSKAFDAAA